MREYRFRAWDKKHKKMIKDIWIAPHYGWLVLSDNDAMAERERPKEGQCILMQSTGLRDRHGKEIFEGDIVARYVFNRPSKKEVEAWRGAVMMVHGEWTVLTEGLWRLQKKIEITGNIHEHPEILEGAR